MGNGVTLLVVEDEPLVQLMVREMLVEAGHAVRLADDGAQAIRLVHEPDCTIGGIVTDIRLGTGPDGWAVARRARALMPHLPVVYVTGDSGYNWATLGVPGSLLVQKPFTSSQLNAAVVAVLKVAEPLSMTFRL